MDNVINLKQFNDDKDLSEWFLKGKKALNQVSQKEGDAIIQLVGKVILSEVEFGLGLLDVPDEEYVKDTETPFFDMINKVYQRAAHGCYLCDPMTDPNGEEFTGNLCLDCQQKLGNIMKFLDVEYKHLLPMAGVRKIQKMKRR